MPEWFQNIKPILSDSILQFDLLTGFVWYISIIFLIGIILRIRFYFGIYHIVEYVRHACPNIYRLIHEHKFLCLKDGLIARTIFYGVILGVYVIFSRFVSPVATVNLHSLSESGRWVVIVNLVLIGSMVAIDLYLLLQITVLDVERVKADLRWSEQWLGGKIYGFLNFLGKWNPLKRYADSVTKENMIWVNEIFRNSVSAMILQVAVRLSVAVVLFLSFFYHDSLVENVQPALDSTATKVASIESSSYHWESVE